MYFKFNTLFLCFMQIILDLHIYHFHCSSFLPPWLFFLGHFLSALPLVQIYWWQISCLSMSENVFISTSFLKFVFVMYRILDWQLLFPFLFWKYHLLFSDLHCFCWKVSFESSSCFFVAGTFFFFFFGLLLRFSLAFNF